MIVRNELVAAGGFFRGPQTGPADVWRAAGQPAQVRCADLAHRSRAASPAAWRARVKTASSIAGVTRPVNVFCWLG